MPFCAPASVQFIIYLFIGAICAVVNLILFLGLFSLGLPAIYAAPVAFALAAVVNYWLCIKVLFKHKKQWSGVTEFAMYALLVLAVAIVDMTITQAALVAGVTAGKAKLGATFFAFVLNFAGRKYLIFRLGQSGSWRPSNPENIQKDAISHSGTEVPLLPTAIRTEVITATRSVSKV